MAISSDMPSPLKNGGKNEEFKDFNFKKISGLASGSLKVGSKVSGAPLGNYHFTDGQLKNMNKKATPSLPQVNDDQETISNLEE